MSRITGTHYVDIDLALESDDVERSRNGRYVIVGPAAEDLNERRLRARVLERHGPAGGNPLVRVFGSKTRLAEFLQTFDEGWRELFTIQKCGYRQK